MDLERAIRWFTMVLAVTAAGLVSVLAVTPAAAAGRRPPCTKAAFVSGLHRGATPFPHGHVHRPWACRGRFAYALVDIDGNTATVLFIAHGRRWATADRGKWCPSGKVPRHVYQIGCTTN